MRVRALKSIAVYRVEEDDEVVWLDMRTVGLRVISVGGDFERYFEVLRDTARELGVLREGESLREYTLRYRARRRGAGHLLFALLVMRGRRVVSVIFGSTRQGLLKLLDRKLTAQGWRRLFFVEMIPLSRGSPHLRGARRTPL